MSGRREGGGGGGATGVGWPRWLDWNFTRGGGELGLGFANGVRNPLSVSDEVAANAASV